MPLGATFQDHWPTIEPDLPPLPAAEQAPAVAAAPAGSAPAGAASAAYWADPSTQAAGYAAYAPAQDAMAWAPAQPVMQVRISVPQLLVIFAVIYTLVCCPISVEVLA